MSVGLTKALILSGGGAVCVYLSFGFTQMLKAFTPLIVVVVVRAVGVQYAHAFGVDVSSIALAARVAGLTQAAARACALS